MQFVARKTSRKATDPSIWLPARSPATLEPAVQRQQELKRAVHRITTRPVAAQKQSVRPVLEAARLHAQEVRRVGAQGLALRHQVSELSTVLPEGAVAAALRRRAPRGEQAPPTRPHSPADWATVMRRQAEQVEGRRLDPKSYGQFTGLQRQVAEHLTMAFKQDRQSVSERHRTFAAPLAHLQGHELSRPVAQVVMRSLPSTEREAMQRAVDDLNVREVLQCQQDDQALTLYSLQRQLAELDEQVARPVLARIQARRGSGNPLPEAVRRHLEQGLNHDLGRVRVHDDAEADRLAKGVNALAFTTGTDIYFQTGKFNPNTQSGLELLAHEVTHTVQQSQGRVGKGVDPDAGLESEAQATGARLARTFKVTSFVQPPQACIRRAPRMRGPWTATHSARRHASAGAAIQRRLWGDWWKTFRNKALEVALEGAARIPNGEVIVSAFRRSQAVFQKVFANPAAFFANLFRSVKNGFLLFKGNIATHLKTALVDWLTGTSVSVTGGVLAFPKSLDGKELLGFGMNVLGLNTAALVARLGKRYGAANVQKAQGQLAVLQQARTGLHNLNDFRSLDAKAKDGMLSAARTYAIQTVAQQAVVWVTGFLATGGLGPVAKAAFSLVSTFLQNARTFGQLGKGVLDSVQDIASGQLGAAARKVEQNLGRVTGLVLKFVSKLLGLDKIGGALRKGLGAVQKPIDATIDRIVGSGPVQAVFQKLKVGKAQPSSRPANDTRTTKEKERDLDQAIKRGTDLLRLKKFTPQELDEKLDDLRTQFRLKVLKVISKATAPLTVERRIYGEVNPRNTGPAVTFTLPEPWQGTRKSPIPVLWPKPATKDYPTIYFGGQKARRTSLRTNAVLAGMVGHDDPEVPGVKIRAFKPHRRSTLAGGEVIGLAQKNQVQVGKTLLFDAALSTKTSGGETFNKVARKYGLDIQGSRFNADHVLERQLGGADSLDNLWPLNASINGSGGSALHYMQVELVPGVWSKMTDMKGTNRKYFLKVVSTL